MESNRLPKGHVYTGRGEIVDMDLIVRNSQKTVSERASEINPTRVAPVQARGKIRGNVVRGQAPRTPTLFSANTPEGLEPTMAELTGVRIDRLKHIKVVRPPTQEEIDGFVESNANSVVQELKHHEPTTKKTMRPKKSEVSELEKMIDDK